MLTCTTKTCSKCLQEKELSLFHRDSCSTDGLDRRCKTCKADWQKANKDKVLLATTKWQEKNQDKKKEIEKRWRLSNKAKKLSLNAAYRSRKLLATPPWISEEQLMEIELVYAEAQRLFEESGIPQHVDHVVPLCNDKVCGLHLPWNLQVIPAIENLKKTNLFWPDMWDQCV